MSNSTGANQWFPVHSKKVQGVVVLIHGLNQSRASWKDMITALNSWGYHVYLLCLKGHCGVTKDGIFHVNAEIWLQNFLDGYREADSKHSQLPRLLVAYSLGALVAIVAQGKLGRNLFDRQVLLAPALVTKLYTRLALLAGIFIPQIPSRSPEYYRANRDGVSAAGYKALFDLEATLRNDLQIFPTCPTRIVMRRDDELINYNGVRKLIKRKKLDTYELRTIPDDDRSSYIPPYKHLIIDRQGLGENEWQWLLAEMKLFLVDGD